MTDPGFTVASIGGGWYLITCPAGVVVRRCRGRSRADALAAIYSRMRSPLGRDR